MISILIFWQTFAFSQRCLQSVSASGTQTVCQNTASVNLTSSFTQSGSGMPVNPSYQWFSNSVNNNTTGTLIPGATSSTYNPPTTTAGITYYYVRIINNNSAGTCSGGSNVSGTVAVTVNQAPTTANAGPDQAICNSSTATLAGNTPSVGTGLWTLVSGSGSITTPSSPNSGVTGLGIGANVFKWTTTQGSCSTSDNVTITRNALPNVNAGTDKVLTCSVLSVTLNGSSSTSGATFNWTTIGGNITGTSGGGMNATVNAGGTYILTVTSPAGCTSKDTAMVTVDRTAPTVNAGSDKILNCVVTSVMLNGSSTTSPVTYSWATIGGNFVTSSTVANPTVNAPGTYILTVTNTSNGCTSKDTTIVTLNNTPPNVSAGPDMTINCFAPFVFLDGSSSTSGAQFSWTTPNGSILFGETSDSPLVVSAGIYILTVTDPNNGCSAKDTAEVFVNTTPPDVNASVDSVINCYHTSVELTGSSATLHTSFSWTTGDGNIVIGANTQNPIVNAAGTYVLTVTDSINGCSSSDTVTVTSDYGIPDVNAGNDTTLTCTVTQVTLNGSSTTPNAQFQWTASNGGVIFSGANTATPLVQIPGTYILTVKDPVNGCTAQDSAVVFQNVIAPNAEGGDTMVLNCAVFSVVLNGTTSTGNTSYSWFTLDGNIVSGSTTLTPTVDAPGTYFLTVTDTINGCQSTDVAEVILNNTPPNVNAGVDSVLTCAVTSLVLTGSSSSPGATYSWSTVGGNIVSGGLSTTPTIDLQGAYILTVTDTINFCIASDTAQVSLNITPPNVNASVDSVINCYHTSVELTGTSSTLHTSFNWSTSDGNIVSGADTQNPIVNLGGTYILTVTDSINGCSSNDTIVVISNLTPPTVNAGNDTTLTCAITQLTLNGSSSTSGAIYSWIAINGGAIASGENTQTPLVTMTGTYILTVKDPVNGCTSMDTVVVDQNITPPNAEAGTNKILNCIDTVIVLNGSSSTSNTIFTWVTFDGNVFADINTATPTVDEPGNYYIIVTDTINGCVSIDSVVVDLNNTIPNVNAGVDTILNCAVTSIVLTGSSTTQAAVYSWVTIGGNIVSGNLTSMPTIDDDGSYILTVTDTVNGCNAKDTALVLLNITPPDVNASVDSVINCYHTSVELTGTSATLHTSFSWTTSNGNIVSGANTQNPIVDMGGTYILTVTDSVNGCSASDTISVLSDFAVPNASAGNDTTLTCTLTSVALNGSSTTPGAIFSWTATNGGVIFSGENTANPLVQIPGTYILTVKNPVNGCTAQDSALVFQNVASPHVEAGDTLVLTCTVTSLMLNGSSSTSNTSYLWTTLDGNIVSGNNTLTPLINAPGSYLLTVTDTINGCQSGDVAVVTLNNTSPDANAGPDETLTCVISAVMLSGSSTTANAQFSWTTSDGNIALGASSANPVVTSAGTYVLMVTDPVNGCTSFDTAMVILNNSIPDVSVSADTVINCINTSIILEGGSVTADVSFSWSTNMGNIISANDSTHIMVNEGGTYVLVVTDIINGCTSSDSIIVSKDTVPPNVNAGPDTTLTCTVTQITLDGSSTNPSVSYLWSTIDGNIVSDGNTANAVINEAGTYVLTVTNLISGCTASDTLLVNTDSAISVADAGIDTQLTCSVSLVALIGIGSEPGSTGIWTNVNGDTIPSSSFFANVSVADTYVLHVTHSTSGCVSSDSVIVASNITPPDVNAGTDTLLGCGNDTITLHGSSTNSVSINWSTLNGNIVSGSDSTDVTVSATGTYVLTVTDLANGCMASDTVNVGANELPVVDLGNDTTVVFCQGFLTLDAGNQGGSFLWSTNETTQTIDVSTSGSYYVRVTNSLGCVGYDTINVTVNQGIVYVDLGSDTTVTFCVGSIMLDAGNQGGTYLWSTSETSQTIHVSSSGAYYVTVTDNVGCSASDTINVTVNPGNVIVDLGNDTTFMNCHAPPFYIDAGNPDASYSWSNGQTSQSILVTTTGSYYVEVTDQVGCVGTDTINVTIINNNIEANLGPDTTVCSCILLSPGIPGVSYHWSTGSEYAIINACSTGNYWVTVNNGTCMDSDTVHVTMTTPPVVDLGNDTTVIGSIVLDAGHPGATYIWSNGATTQTITVTMSGIYFVIVQEGLGCVASDTIKLDVIIGIDEIANVDLGVKVFPNPSIDKSFNLTFNAIENSDVNINITNILGEVMYSENLLNHSGLYDKKIELKDVAGGVYFVNVITDKRRSTTKLIIE